MAGAPDPNPPVPPDPPSLGPHALKDAVMTEPDMVSLIAAGPHPPSQTCNSAPPLAQGILGSHPPSVSIATSGLPLPSSGKPVSTVLTSQVDFGLPNQTTQGPLPASPPEYNWASRCKGASKFPNTEAEVSVSAEGTPRVKVPNAVFERGARLHSDYIVDIFYVKAPSYGKVWAVLNYLWEWKASFSRDPPSLQKAPIWATLSRVPFDLLTAEGLSFISSPLGKICAC
ncbi:PREDICTED: hyphal wall protein 1-like [Camelina sativa]|uniref:Hyphal wall protein 1-like n=1 Tax=Camelina sativa TaxID=90675 RepID=A0ABM1QVP2_CAMSA|nr:PREDICTED: hyphal wall protein 1-like [Camelina sativa]